MSQAPTHQADSPKKPKLLCGMILRIIIGLVLAIIVLHVRANWLLSAEQSKASAKHDAFLRDLENIELTAPIMRVRYEMEINLTQELSLVKKLATSIQPCSSTESDVSCDFRAKLHVLELKRIRELQVDRSKLILEYENVQADLQKRLSKSSVL